MNILYIHGLGTNENSTQGKIIKAILKDDNVIHPSFGELTNYDEVKSHIEQVVRDNDVDLIIGHSFGGFYTLDADFDLPKIIVNPCMLPSVEIPKLTKVSDSFKKYFEAKEDQLYKEKSFSNNIIGIFADSDKLFRYRSYADKLGIKTLGCEGTHRILRSFLEEPLLLARKLLDIKRIDESIKNIDVKNNPKMVDKFKDDVWEILQDAYEPIGGIEGCNSIEELIRDSDLWKVRTVDHDVVAVTVYTKKRGGRKIQYLGGEKKYLYELIWEDMNAPGALGQDNRQVWIEVDDKLRHIFKKYGDAPDVSPEDAKRMLPDKEFLRVNDDGSYERVIGNNLHKKYMVGHLPK